MAKYFFWMTTKKLKKKKRKKKKFLTIYFNYFERSEDLSDLPPPVGLPHPLCFKKNLGGFLLGLVGLVWLGLVWFGLVGLV